MAKTDIQPYEKVTLSRKSLIINNFLGGIMWGLGATVGASIIIAILTIIAHFINVIPIVGTFLSSILDFILKNNHHFK